MVRAERKRGVETERFQQQGGVLSDRRAGSPQNADDAVVGERVVVGLQHHLLPEQILDDQFDIAEVDRGPGVDREGVLAEPLKQFARLRVDLGANHVSRGEAQRVRHLRGSCKLDEVRKADLSAFKRVPIRRPTVDHRILEEVDEHGAIDRRASSVERHRQRLGHARRERELLPPLRRSRCLSWFVPHGFDGPSDNAYPRPRVRVSRVPAAEPERRVPLRAE